MIDYHERLPLPGPGTINTGLSPAHQATMLGLFGRPGRLTQDCSAITNARLAGQLQRHDFNNFSVTGWAPAVRSLVAVLTEVYQTDPALHAVVRTAGMLCCRAVRGSQVNYSNHSFGSAIDIEIMSDLTPRGADYVTRGLLMLYPFFHRHGWYWGVSFPTPDPQHFEIADETLRRLYQENYGQ